MGTLEERMRVAAYFDCPKCKSTLVLMAHDPKVCPYDKRQMAMKNASAFPVLEVGDSVERIEYTETGDVSAVKEDGAITVIWATGSPSTLNPEEVRPIIGADTFVRLAENNSGDGPRLMLCQLLADERKVTHL